MDPTLITSGSLFTRDYLAEAIKEVPEWAEIDAAQLRADLVENFAGLPAEHSPNETQTEDEIIWPVLARLGWHAYLRQQNLTERGRDDVPDGLLFLAEEDKAAANGHPEEWKRYGHGIAIVESKRWGRPLDRRSGRRDEANVPSTQMLRYLRRVEDLTAGNLRWGILTNGAVWRLYYQGARSVSEQFFEIDLATLLGQRGDLFDAVDDAEAQATRDHWLRVFALMFRDDAFAPSATSHRTFHQRALEEGRFYEERVAQNLSDMVFTTVFPSLARAISASAPEAPLDEVRDAALILLYRLLFLLYAEDRNLLPVRDGRYDDYALRDNVRGDVGRRKDRNDTFSVTAGRYWSVIDDLCRAIDRGDASIGLPPYNGGLFDPDRTPILTRIRIPDTVMAEVIDLLSFERTGGRRRYINYRDLSVQQLGSIYERLLEFEIRRDEDEGLVVRPNLFARKSTGSYYTPDELVGLILRETLEPLITDRLEAFRARAEELADDPRDEATRLGALRRLDPAEAVLTLRVCDPAMGSGHFLVNLVDYLTDQVIEAMAEAEAAVEWATEAPYESPLAQRIATIRETIRANAEENRWAIDDAQLDDRHVIRRMVLKRCVYGVDKNPMAVELAKVSLWLHTFTVGAPLSFLDHHLRCGDSLFGTWVAETIERLGRQGGRLLINEPLRRATGSAASMQTIEGLTDAEIAEAHRSAQIYDGIVSMTEPLDSFMQLLHAIDWLDLKNAADRAAVQAWLDGQFGDAVEIARGRIAVALAEARQGELIPSGNPEQRDMLAPGAPAARAEAARFAEILRRARTLIEEERFLNWEVAFPGVWRNWEEGRQGGFDAVVGNPPWDRIKLQQVEWFAAREPRIARAQRAADRSRMIAELERANAPLAAEYAKASARAEAGARMARRGGDYPLLSGGDINIYSLFVERGMALLKPEGVLGLLTPSGIASDKTASAFFKQVATTGRLKGLFDFENKKVFFPDVHASFKFCAFIASRVRRFAEARCAFYLHSVDEIHDPDRCFPLSPEDFARLNPNTGTAPILRSRRDAELTTAIYARLPVLVDRSGGDPVRSWPVRYATMFHMTNDSHLFRTEAMLAEQEGAWRVGGNVWQNAQGRWLPLYVGRLIHQFDHRAASVAVNVDNVHNAAFSGEITDEQKADPAFAPAPQYWVSEAEVSLPPGLGWLLAFRDIARATDVRTMIAAAIPAVAVGNTAPLIWPTDVATYRAGAPLWLANLNALALDYVDRQKAQSTHLNWYIVEQLPVVPTDRYDTVRFGPRTAGEIVREAVLELTYTAHDMAPFARDMGHVDETGTPLPPFRWDGARRLRLRAKLDAVYFHLYGLFDPADRARSRDDIAYIYSTFPIVERQERAAWGTYRSRDLCLAYCNALAAGQPDAEPETGG